MFAACAAYCLFPLFHTAWTLAAVSFVPGIGCGQPLGLTLVYDASPKGRAGETAGMRVMANRMMRFTIPLLFGALGSVAAMAAVFIASAAGLVMTWRQTAASFSRSAKVADPDRPVTLYRSDG